MLADAAYARAQVRSTSRVLPAACLPDAPHTWVLSLPALPPLDASPRLQEEESLERAQRSGEAAAGRASQRMAQEWLELTRTPEWRTLATRYPQAVSQLSEAASVSSTGGGGRRASGGDGTAP